VTSILQKNSKGLTLYCVAWSFKYFNVFTNKVEEKLGFDYMHADHSGHARAQFMNANTFRSKHGKLKIISSSPVIGFHALDDNGDNAVA